jgi:hypothetical protein
MWCVQTIYAEYRSRMYNILDLYQEDYDPKYPLICLDEKPKKLIGDKRKGEDAEDAHFNDAWKLGKI